MGADRDQWQLIARSKRSQLAVATYFIPYG